MKVPLVDPVQGTSQFQQEFAAAGPVDSKGRSLRQFDLKTRLFLYPCSFLIASESFQQLPAGVQTRVWQRLDTILSGQDNGPQFAHLSPEDRLAIREIVTETCPEAWPDAKDITALKTDVP